MNKRTIKFRAWDNDFNCYLKDFISFGSLFAINSDLYDIEQFTGIYDSTDWHELTEEERAAWTLAGNLPSWWKCKEIYEGDIVKIYDNVFTVYYEPLLASFRLFRELLCGTSDFSLSCGKNFVPNVSIKVIGNIHQNKELLGVGNE